jgi:hypothetical protein
MSILNINIRFFYKFFEFKEYLYYKVFYMSQKLIITENEKTRILDLYGVLKKKVNEQAPTTTAKPTTTSTKTLEPITIKVTFKSGCHSNKGGQECPANQITNMFAPYMEKIKEFLKSAPTNQVVEVVLSASESKVPNRDGELPKTELQKDGTKKHPKLELKVLSQYRYKSIEEYLKGVFEKMVSDKIITKIPEFVKSDVVIGGPEWSTSKGADHSDYTKHQYLNAVIKLKEGAVEFKPEEIKPGEAKLECIKGIKIEYSYDEVVEQVAPHCCNRGRFNLFANGVLLKRTDGKTFASINNGDKVTGEVDKQADSRPQEMTWGKVWSKDGKNELCYTNKSAGQVDWKGTRRHTLNSIPESKPGNYRYNTFVIDAAQAAAIVKATGGKPSYLQIKAAPTSENSNPHQEAVRCTIYRADGTIAYDSCNGGNCEKTAVGPWNINFCSAKSTPSA